MDIDYLYNIYMSNFWDYKKSSWFNMPLSDGGRMWYDGTEDIPAPVKLYPDLPEEYEIVDNDNYVMKLGDIFVNSPEGDMWRIVTGWAGLRIKTVRGAYFYLATKKEMAPKQKFPCEKPYPYGW